MPTSWLQKETIYLMNNWGTKSITCLSQNLKKSESAIINKAQKLELGSFLESGEYITVNQFMKTIGRNGCWTYTLNQWINKGFPIRKKKVRNYSFKVVYLEDFWKWAKEYRMCIDFSKFKENVLGKEPQWVKEQRKADIEFAKYKVVPWTKEEDNLLKSLLSQYRYTYKTLSLRLMRTEGAVKRRIHDLHLDTWPIRKPSHGIWTTKQENTVIDMYNKGYRSAVIKQYIDKSEQSINGKIERLINQGKLIKRK